MSIERATSTVIVNLHSFFQVEKTVNMVRGALNFIDDIQQAQEITNYPPRDPLTDAEFRKYLDPVGQLIKPEEFRNAIYFGGVEASLRLDSDFFSLRFQKFDSNIERVNFIFEFRKVVWKHLLNVYPSGLSGRQRIDYMKRKAYEYEQLKNSWRNVDNDKQVRINDRSCCRERALYLMNYFFFCS